MRCRICESKTKEFLDLGTHPIANDLRTTPVEGIFYHLKLAFCPICLTVQLVNVISPESMFNDRYPFCTSSSNYMIRHFKRLADLIKDEYLPNDGLIVEIGSNDGTFLNNFILYEHIGIEPSSNVMKKANNLNIVNAFFNEELAEEIIDMFGKADVIVSTNTFPHIEDRGSVLRGIKKLLQPDGIWINEEAYLGSIIANVSYDQFYNEHIYTSSIASFRTNIQRYGLELLNCEFQRVHGGSMRYYVTHQSNALRRLSNLRNILYAVCKENLVDYVQLKNFGIDVKKSKERFLNELGKVDGPIVGYGATAKCSTIVNYCRLDKNIIECVYDTTEEKSGKYIPGTDIPIVHYSFFDKDAPKNVVLFAWNHLEEIFEKEKGKKINWILPI